MTDQTRMPKSPSVQQTIYTIQILEKTSLAVDSRHFHSFQCVSLPFLLVLSPLKCGICKEKLRCFLGQKRVGKADFPSAGVDERETQNNEIVRCLACGIYVHRKCLASSWSDKEDSGNLEVCGVNRVVVEQAFQEPSRNFEKAYASFEKIGSDDDSHGKIKQIETACKSGKSENYESCVVAPHKSEVRMNCPIQLGNKILSKGNIENDSNLNICKKKRNSQHGAIDNSESLDRMGNSVQQNEAHETQKSKMSEHEINLIVDGDNSQSSNALEEALRVFSRVLHENLVAFSDRLNIINMDNAHTQGEKFTENINNIMGEYEIEARRSEDEDKEMPTQLSAKQAFETLVKIRQTGSNLTVSTLAGGFAGGVAGLRVAGPAGAYMGMKLGQVGVIVESGLRVGVLAFSLVASIKAHKATEDKIKKEKVRMLTIGEEGMKRKMMLVRPKVHVNKEWEDICLEKRNIWLTRKKPNGNGVYFNFTSTSGSNEKRNDDDILGVDETEIHMKDKVLLLVSRSLNDKYSLPGFVYREMINVFQARRIARTHNSAVESEKRGNFVSGIIKGVRKDEDCAEQNECMAGNQNFDKDSLDGDADSMKCNPCFSRCLRQDAHGIIKYVTSLLLEVRPGFSSSPSLTEMSAAAVESIVFGELYDHVFHEITLETNESDNTLLENIYLFESENSDFHHNNKTISETALRTLHMLSEAHSPSDKLSFCVKFMEKVSETSSFEPGKIELGADALLKSVCQHIIVAKLPKIFAEILFLEEFARDESLLKGKEGYALVTMQAALHFLNSSNDLKQDFFYIDLT